MTSNELEQLMTKLSSGMKTMNNPEFSVAYNLYHAAMEYRDVIQKIVNVDRGSNDE